MPDIHLPSWGRGLVLRRWILTFALTLLNFAGWKLHAQRADFDDLLRQRDDLPLAAAEQVRIIAGSGDLLLRLLGDILDLQLANWAQAIEGMILPNRGRVVGFRHFINHLLEQTGATEIWYIPGNHDYRIFDYHSIDRYLIRPDELDKVYVGNDAGVFVLDVVAGIWTNLTKNLPNAMVIDLVFQENDKALFAATYGRSIWRIKL